MNPAQSVAAAAARSPDMPSYEPEAAPWPNGAVAELYAHALVASTQAAAACHELCEIFDARGERETSAVFALLATAEAERAAEAVRRIGARALPPGLSWQHYSWFYRDAPNHGARKLVAQLMTARIALLVALEITNRARARYEELAIACEHADARAQAREFAIEKSLHARRIREALGGLAQAAVPGGDEAPLFGTP